MRLWGNTTCVKKFNPKTTILITSWVRGIFMDFKDTALRLLHIMDKNWRVPLKNKLSRRDALKLGLGAAVLAVPGNAASVAKTESTWNSQEAKHMTALSELNKFGEDLERQLILRTSPIAVKMLEKESDIPKGSIRPLKDRGCHLAQCQAFALSRREGITVVMQKEDHWCPTALMAYGHVPQPADINKWSHPYDCFERDKYIGIATAPLKTAGFMPDVVIVYAKPAQLRSLLLSMKMEDVPQVSGHFFPPSCAWAVVNPMQTGRYYMVMPDPGEYQRALTEEGDMMFAIPQVKMAVLIEGMKKNEHGPFSYRDHHMFMQTDFPRTDFYKEMFKSWGLDAK